MKRLNVLLATIAVIAAVLVYTLGTAVAFTEQKTVRIIVGTNPGG